MSVNELPPIGLGTYSDSDKEGRIQSVATGCDMGYRHIDTAQVYGNEEYVGEGIRQSTVSRNDVFIATKTVHHDVPGPDYEDVLQAVDGCLQRLGVETVELLYVHWPTGVYDPEVTLPAFDSLYKKGTIGQIGVSNFTPAQLDEARETLDAPVFAHQIEMHPLLQQDELLAYAQRHDHYLVAYCPLAQGTVFDVPEITAIADKHSVSEAQVSLAWLLSKDNVRVIPKATSESHLRENLEARSLSLDPEDIDRIEALECEERIIDPDRAPWNDIYHKQSE
jgi:2,5-diketo-D-gluconate reductase B